jgi:hypothetical protein
MSTFFKTGAKILFGLFYTTVSNQILQTADCKAKKTFFR